MPLLDSGYSSTASLVGHPTAFYSFSFPPFPPINSFPFLSYEFLPFLIYVSFPLCFFPPPLLLPFISPFSSSGRRLPSWRPTLWCYHHTSRKSAMLYNVHFKIKKINKMVSLPSDTKDTQHLSHTEIDANMARSLIPAGCVQRSSLQHLVSEELC